MMPDNPYPSRVKATQEKYPWRTTIRTVFEATVSFAAMWPLMVVALDLGGGPWVAASLAMTAAVTRVMAVPEVNAWLEKYLPWLAAEPTGGGV